MAFGPKLSHRTIATIATMRPTTIRPQIQSRVLIGSISLPVLSPVRLNATAAPALRPRHPGDAPALAELMDRALSG